MNTWQKACFGSACALASSLAPLAEAASYHSDLEGERMNIRLFANDRPGELRGYADTTDWTEAQAGEYTQRVEQVFPIPTAPAAVGPLMAAVAPFAVGFIVDAIQGHFEREALKYERQFTATVYDDAFWKEAGGSESPRYAAFELRRETDRASGKAPAFRLLCAFDPSESDDRLFLIKPLCLEINSAKAKMGGRKLTTTVNIAIDGTWLDDKLNERHGRIAETTWTFGGYDVKKNEPEFFLDEDHQSATVAGWFRGVPLSYREAPDSDNDGKPDGPSTRIKNGGAFKLTILVTERDESRAKQVFERIAKFIGDKKGDIVSGVTGN